MRHSRKVPRARQAGRGSTLLGIFIGLVLGLSIAAAVAFFLGRSGLTSPLQSPGTAKEPARAAKGEFGAQGTTPDKPRFDFYKILPGAEEPKSSVDRRPADKGAERALGCPAGKRRSRPCHCPTRRCATASGLDLTTIPTSSAASRPSSEAAASTLP